MLVGQDLDSSQNCKEFFMDIIKKTILQQDMVFRMQVHELHRLYQVQKLLSKDIAKELHDLTSFKNEINSSQKVFSGPFDLRQSADEFITNGILDCADNGSKCNPLRNPMFSEPLLPGSKERSKSCVENENETFQKNVIDLEDSVWKVSCNHLISRKIFPEGDLDLNEPFIDDSSHDSNAFVSEFASAVKNCQVSEPKPNGIRSEEDLHVYSSGTMNSEKKPDDSLTEWRSCCSDDNSSSLKSTSRDHLMPKNDNNQDENKRKRTDLAEDSEILQRAAESLIHLSSAKGLENETGIDENPHLSGDSFENIVLKLTHNDFDDEAASFKSINCDNTIAVDNSCKLRRGRRMKNFQKEILPSIVSLAVQEIREDINTMEGVLRSREYRKRRAKMAVQDHSWCIVKQRTRSKLPHVRRRIFT